MCVSYGGLLTCVVFTANNMSLIKAINQKDIMAVKSLYWLSNITH